jgi:hypothetical protein
MPSLFEPAVASAILLRIENLTVANQKQWGKMTAAQTLAHLRTVLELGTGDRTEKPNLIGLLLGPIIKKVVLNDKPYKQGLPTGPNFIIKDDKNFEEEKAKLIAVYKKFIERGASMADGFKHPLFGKMTAYEWGFSQWKHFDHHLRQFNA